MGDGTWLGWPDLWGESFPPQSEIWWSLHVEC